MFKWISTKDRLPKDGQKVLFYGDFDFMVGWYYPDDKYWMPIASDSILYQQEVTYWTELPEPPEGDNNV